MDGHAADKGENTMNNKNINAIISIASVLVMIVWGTLAGSYKQAWLAVLAGGVLITILSLYNKGRTDTETADKISDGSKGGVTTESKTADEPSEE